jgi:hypothetical protein
MEKIRIRKRIYGTLTEAQKRRFEKDREAIAKELPDLIRRNQMRFDARKEKTFSGALRRAIHQFPQSPMKIAENAEIAWTDLSTFLTGEQTLPSDAIDRLVKVVKMKLPASKPMPRRKKAKAS